MKKDFIGKLGEKISGLFLILKGYRILKRNYLIKGGEIDIIAEKNNTLVIVEVKTRRNTNFGDPMDAVNYAKRQHIIYATKNYIKRYNKYDMNVRFDVIEIVLNKFKIHHIKDAFCL